MLFYSICITWGNKYRHFLGNILPDGARFIVDKCPSYSFSWLCVAMNEMRAT